MGIAQQQFEINEQNIKKLMELTGQEFRQCQRKAYDVAACRVNEDIYFANRLTHPISYQAIVKATHGKPLIARAEAEKDAALMAVLHENGCDTYKGGDYNALMCGTYGELSILHSSDLQKNYIFGDDIIIDTENLYPRWNLLHRKGESKPTAVGIQLPVQYLGVYQTYKGTKYANNPTERGHGSGDILVIPTREVKYKNYRGTRTETVYDYNDIEVVNNAVFARTYNQNIGGWGKSGLITEESKMAMPSIEQLNNCINKSKGITFAAQSAAILTNPVSYTFVYYIRGTFETGANEDGYYYDDVDTGDIENFDVDDSIYDYIDGPDYDDEDLHNEHPFYKVRLGAKGRVTFELMARTEAEANQLSDEYLENKVDFGDITLTDYDFDDMYLTDEAESSN